MYHFLDDVLNINSTFSLLLLVQRVWAFYVIFYINFSFMEKMLSSAADSSFPRQMKEQNIKIELDKCYSFYPTGHCLNLLCTGHKEDLFCEVEQEKVHTSSQ